MDTSVVAKFIILAILILLSAFFSASETALTTVNAIRIRSLAENKVKGAITVEKLTTNPGKMLSTILIGNNIVNLTASSMATIIAMQYFGDIYISISTGIVTLLILIFGEITPKTLATMYAESLSLKVAFIIYFLSKIFTPIIWIIEKISLCLLYMLRIDTAKRFSYITEYELRKFVDVSHEHGVIESEERKMITNVVDFGDSLAKDVMVPRIDMAFVNIDFNYYELVAEFEKEKYSRMPVYRESRDNVVGIINVKDLFYYNKNKDEFNINEILREPYYTYEYKKTSELMMEMRKASINIAIVLDEYGVTVGLLTLEDLLEEIVGEIRDEYDLDEEDQVKIIGDNEYIVNGSTKLDEINELLSTNFEQDGCDSIAGLIIYLLNHIPEEGEIVCENNIIFTVDAMDKNRVDKIHIHVKSIEDELLTEDVV